MQDTDELLKGCQEPVQTFKKCDMHVHSSSCESRPYVYEAFEKALLESDLDVIAITDHNSVDVDLINRLSRSLSLKNKTLLAGTELNVKIDEETRQKHSLIISPTSEYFHGIIWCDVVDAQHLQQAVFRLLDGIDIDKQSRKEKTAKEISALSKGKAFFLKDVQRELGGIKHFFTFHECKGDKKRNLSGYLKNGQGGNDNFKNSLFYYNQRLAIEGGKKSKPISDFFEIDLNTMVCRFFCSDAKTLGKIGTAYTWIDFDGDIDSLNLAITDPQSRIATSDESPNNPQLNLNDYLESVKFNLLDSEGRPSECEIRFAPSYNGIVGSRGSGKSMLARILSGKISGGYEKHVDPESIHFLVKGGQYSRNLPRCLYVSQGELGDVFDRSDYKSVPFLEQRLKGMKEAARNTSDQHFTSITKQLSLQQELVIGFVEKYEGCLKRPDALQGERPNGISIKRCPSTVSDAESIKAFGEKLNDLIENLRPLGQSALSIKIDDSFPETSDLSVALSKRMTAAVDHLHAALTDLNGIAEAVRVLHSEPFETRDKLLSVFSEEVININKEKSVGAHNYERNVKEATEFIEDLLDLRMDLLSADQEIERSVESMLRPISANTYQADEDEVTIGLTISEVCSYANSLSSQLKSSVDNTTAVARFVLSCSDIDKTKQDLLNGNKFRSATNAADIVERFYSNVENDLSKNREFEIDVSFNGVSMREMSPGMQAQALLKLLLNDKLSSNGYDYVVLDQPEDNLDTPTISDVLVNRIKKLKKEVQVFVVSHSAPVIINGDARNVVMARSDEFSISYSSDVINGRPAKEFISEVLDGGERFLKMRLYKYDFQVGDYDDQCE